MTVAPYSCMHYHIGLNTYCCARIEGSAHVGFCVSGVTRVTET